MYFVYTLNWAYLNAIGEAQTVKERVFAAEHEQLKHHEDANDHPRIVKKDE